MMDSLSNLLLKRDFDEPDELKAIKDYVYKHFKVKVEVKLSEVAITIYSPNASLAGALRLKMPDLKRTCRIKQKIIIKIR